MLLRVTPVIDSDVKVLLINADKVLGLVEYEMDDGPMAAVVMAANDAGEFECVPVRESLEELESRMRNARNG